MNSDINLNEFTEKNITLIQLKLKNIMINLIKHHKILSINYTIFFIRIMNIKIIII